MSQLAGQAVDRGLLRLGYRVLVVLGGITSVVVGLVLIPLPGPGSLIVFLGISLLGREFEWARRLSARVRLSLIAPVLLLPR